MKLYAYEGDQLYLPEHVDIDPITGIPESDSYQAYEINDRIELTPEQCCQGYSNIIEILLQTGQAREI